MKDLSVAMRKSRKPRHQSGRGESWFYISPIGLEVAVASERGQASSNNFLITKKQLEFALKEINAWAKK